MVEDKAKNLVQTYNKENKIISQTIGSKVITYKYDFQSKRVSKTVVNAGLTTTEFYVRDPQGNVLAIYADTLQNARKFTLSELHLYGSSRLGTYKVDSVLWNNGLTSTISNVYTQKLGLKRYELSNHLGNVQTVITDRKLVDTNAGGLITAYKADVQSVTDYYPFGKTISERTWSISKTRYDFNSKETDEESGYQDYGFRDYDVEIARFLQVDPLHASYPWNATYCFAENTPIWGIDLDGAELEISANDPYKSYLQTYVNNAEILRNETHNILKKATVPITVKSIIQERNKKEYDRLKDSDGMASIFYATHHSGHTDPDWDDLNVVSRDFKADNEGNVIRANITYSLEPKEVQRLLENAINTDIGGGKNVFGASVETYPEDLNLIKQFKADNEKRTISLQEAFKLGVIKLKSITIEVDYLNFMSAGAKNGTKTVGHEYEHARYALENPIMSYFYKYSQPDSGGHGPGNKGGIRAVEAHENISHTFNDTQGVEKEQVRQKQVPR